MRWPACFPYPISWLRAFAASLLTLVFGLSLRLTGFWGLIFAAFTDQLLPLVILVAVGLTAQFCWLPMFTTYVGVGQIIDSFAGYPESLVGEKD